MKLLLSLLILMSTPASSVAATSKKCFTDREELKTAVDTYIKDGCADIFRESCKISTAYGWPMNAWCVQKVTDMSFLFFLQMDFNEDISDWDTSSVTDMGDMFYNARSFNGYLSKWNTSSVSNMERMFYYAKSFNLSILHKNA